MTVQVAIAIIMLTCAGLLVRSLAQLQHVDVGFSPDHVIVAQLNLPLDKFGPKLSHLYSALDQAVEQARGLPGVARRGRDGARTVRSHDGILRPGVGRRQW